MELMEPPLDPPLDTLCLYFDTARNLNQKDLLHLVMGLVQCTNLGVICNRNLPQG